MDKPVLSIGIIFKDDIRSIKRCLKALQPLRDTAACELVMADTGSTDGSRAVAEQYADVLFAFPWINDFAAARNAVIERCSGEWFLSVDTDEYLDEDISELVGVLRANDPSTNLYQVNIRNHRTYEMDGAYSDFYTLRMVRLTPGTRYKGEIHESWTGIERLGPPVNLPHTVFHHDGYVDMGNNTVKLERNMSLLRQKVKLEPQNLLVRLQMVESGVREKDYIENLRKTVALVRRHVLGWEIFGPPIMRYAFVIAKDRNLPELEQWKRHALEWFPESYFTRIDVNGQCMLSAYGREDYAECVRLGGELMTAYEDLRAGRGDINCQMYSTLQMASPHYEQLFRLMMAVSCLEERQPERSLSYLEAMDFTQLDGELTANLAKTFCSLRCRSDLEFDDLTLAAWEGITTPKPSEKRAEERRAIFMLNASTAFTPQYRREEDVKGYRHAYALFAPLAGKCGIGTAAAIMSSENPGEITALLGTVEKWNELPFPALSWAILRGVEFPLPEQPMSVEALDGLASRLAGDWDTLVELLETVVSRDFSMNWQSLTWARSLALSAVRSCKWNSAEQGTKLARTFAVVGNAYLPRCYSPEILLEKNLRALPPMDRFGWYCAQAFDCLEAGDTLGYVRLLRAGLNSYEGAKPMVEFLLDHTPELQAPPPSPELLELAEKVKTMLTAYPPDDPAVTALKTSEVYQKVAYLIEGGE